MPKATEENLTASRLKALTTEKRQQTISDHVVPGLYVRVSGTTGAKSWLVRYKVKGRGSWQKKTFGGYPDISLAEAREKAREIRAQARRGRDVFEEEEERLKPDHTFEGLAREVLAYRATKTREGTQRERERILEKDLLPEFGDRPAADISRRDVVLLVEQIARRAPTMGNRTLSLLHLIFEDGLRRGFPTLEKNPARYVEKPTEEENRDRYLTKDEIAAVWRATEEEYPGTKGAFRLALLTGQRIGAVAAMRWDKIAEETWTIPAEDFKGKRTHLVPLSSEALDVLEELAQVAASQRWVFPSRAGAKKPHVTNLSSNTLARIRHRTKIPHWTTHDFRATFRTHAVRAPERGGLGISPHIADAVLGHAEQSLGFSRYTGSKETYLLHEKRQALEAWGELVRAAVEAEKEPEA